MQRNLMIGFIHLDLRVLIAYRPKKKSYIVNVIAHASSYCKIKNF